MELSKGEITPGIIPHEIRHLISGAYSSPFRANGGVSFHLSNPVPLGYDIQQRHPWLNRFDEFCPKIAGTARN